MTVPPSQMKMLVCDQNTTWPERLRPYLFKWGGSGVSLAVEKPGELAVADTHPLALPAVGPLERHPVAVYLALWGGKRSRGQRSMSQAGGTIRMACERRPST